MTRRLLVLALICAALPADRVLDEQRTAAVVFDQHWNLYIRRLFGCPDAGEISADTCRPVAGTTDYREFIRAREQAKKLFDLRD